jgi:cyanophycinase
MTGPLALVGSGEYLPVMAVFEGRLLAGRPPRYVQLPTAAAPEGPTSLARWVDLGREQAERLGVEHVPLVVRDRDEANDPDLASQVAGAGLVYLSGGNPTYVASTLKDTAVWQAIHAAWQGGAALAGCSAGAMALTSWVPNIRHPLNPSVDGLGVVPHVRVIPHFDRFSTWMPDLVGRYLAKKADHEVVVGIDEDTALMLEGGTWTVHGVRSVWILTAEGKQEFTPGTTVPLD